MQRHKAAKQDVQLYEFTRFNNRSIVHFPHYSSGRYRLFFVKIKKPLYKGSGFRKHYAFF
jgi:hypothetical protein